MLPPCPNCAAVPDRARVISTRETKPEEWAVTIACGSCLTLFLVEWPKGATTLLSPGTEVSRFIERLRRSSESGTLHREIPALLESEAIAVLGVPEVFGEIVSSIGRSQILRKPLHVHRRSTGGLPFPVAAEGAEYEHIVNLKDQKDAIRGDGEPGGILPVQARWETPPGPIFLPASRSRLVGLHDGAFLLEAPAWAAPRLDGETHVVASRFLLRRE